MKNPLFIVGSILIVMSFAGCDARLQMTYSVENRSEAEIKLFVPNFPMDGKITPYNRAKDTILILRPKEKVVVGSGTKIDFPWATKNIYRESPGKCGIKKIDKDTIKFGCTRSEWKYRKGNSTLSIK